LNTRKYVSREGRCYEVIFAKCITRRNGRKDCKKGGKAFRFEVEVDCMSCGNCEEK